MFFQKDQDDDTNKWQIFLEIVFTFIKGDNIIHKRVTAYIKVIKVLKRSFRKDCNFIFTI